MLKSYTKDQLWELYQKLPEELKESISSLNNADNIYNICERNNILEEIIPQIVKYVGYVLLGILPPDQFQEVLERELKIEKGTAKKAAQEINRFVFYPVKPVLEQLYKMEITPSEKPAVEKPTEKPLGKAKLEGEKPSAPPGKDIYRESVE